MKKEREEDLEVNLTGEETATNEEVILFTPLTRDDLKKIVLIQFDRIKAKWGIPAADLNCFLPSGFAHQQFLRSAIAKSA